MIGIKVPAVDALDFKTDPFSDGTWRINSPGRGRCFAKIMNEPERRLYFAGSDVSLALLNG
jgi:monoamine oxidase